MNHKITSAITLLSCLTLFGCSSGSDPASENGNSSSVASGTTQVQKGQAVYKQPLGVSRFACADCHALSEDESRLDTDGFRRAGHPIGDALGRPSYKNMQLFEFVDAANSCLDEWMGADITWDDSSEDYIALKAFLESQPTHTETTAPLTFTIGQNGIPAEQGDAALGKATFNATCAVCHGEDAVLGDNPLGIDIRYIDDSEALQTVLANKIRRSGRANSAVYDDLNGGIMPFWSLERMSDQEIADIGAFLAATDPNNTPIDNPGDNPQGGSGCSATSPKIGQTATLSELAHDVGGTATIVDDCTIRIDNFNYDGEGIVVEFYASQDVQEFGKSQGNYFSITPGVNYLRSGNPYVNEEVTLTLPDGITVDDLDAISVWCVRFGIDFGSGAFQ